MGGGVVGTIGLRDKIAFRVPGVDGDHCPNPKPKVCMNYLRRIPFRMRVRFATPQRPSRV